MIPCQHLGFFKKGVRGVNITKTYIAFMAKEDDGKEVKDNRPIILPNYGPLQGILDKCL